MKERLFKLLCSCIFMLVVQTIVPTAQGQTADQIAVSGTVLDDAAQPVPGASISIVGTTSGISTDVDGKFKLTVPRASKIKIAAIGYKAQELTPTQTMTIRLESTSSDLEEVIVVGYGTQRRGSVTGAVSSISSADLVRTPTSTTSGALVGKVAGITARSTTGRPGSTTTLQIRNLGDPLFVIDGVPQSAGQFNQLGLEDIENISVLKDAAAAIYGFRASNGVVLVTTKKGKVGQSKLNVSSYYGVQNFTRYLSASDAYTYMRAYAEAEQNAGTAAGSRTVTPEILEKWRLGTEPGYQSTNYADFVIKKNAPQKYLNVNASGASDKINYYLSLSKVDQDASLQYYNFNRANFQANVEGTFLPGFKIGTQLSGRIENRNGPASTTGLDVSYDNPFLAILTMWPTERIYANDNPLYINRDLNNPSRNPLLYNPDVIGTDDNTWNNFGSIFYVSMNLPMGLSGKATYSYNYKQNKGEIFRKNYTTYSYAAATDAYIPTTSATAARRKSRNEIKENFAQFQLNYNKTFGSHNIAALGAYEYGDQADQSITIDGVPPTNYSPILRQLADLTTISDIWTENRRASWIGKLNYDFKQKYLFEISARYDGSSLYSSGKRYGLFPGVTAGWIISEEKFFKDALPFVNRLKIRAGVGRTGREQGVGQFAYLTGGNYGTGSAIFDGALTTGIGLRGLPTTNITWVTATQKNLGVDMDFFRGRLTSQFDLYVRKLTGLTAARYDLLIPSEVGYALPDENLESEQTQGADGSIIWSDKAGKVGYSFGVNATIGRRKILDRYKPRFGNSWEVYRSASENRWSNIRWGYQVEGQFTSMEQIKTWPINNDNQGNKTHLPGDLIFKDLNEDGVINAQDERPIGYAEGAQPYMSFGINTSVSFKNFTLSTDWAGATMQTLNRYFELQIPFQANHNAPEYLFQDRWHREDPFDANSPWIAGKYPAIRRGGTYRQYTATSDFWNTNINYLRLRNVELGYNLPKALLGKAHISAMRVYVTGTNVFSFDNTKDYEIDPEISLGAGLVYPNVKQYTFGINLTL